MAVGQTLNVVHVCDHLGWAGSRMHGVKRLFAWMMPRFNRERFTASLVSLRKKDLADDTLEQFGIDVTYLGRHKFDPATFTHLLKVLRAKQADVVHLHGYGATTFGRLCAARLGIPAILHEHANHTDTPWFQKVADAWLARYTDVAIAVSASTAEFTTRARLVPANRTHIVYLGAPLDEFARPRTADEVVTKYYEPFGPYSTFKILYAHRIAIYYSLCNCLLQQVTIYNTEWCSSVPCFTKSIDRSCIRFQ